MTARRTTAPHPVAFAGATLDRAAHLRADDENHQLRRHPDATAILIGNDQQVALAGERAPALARVPLADLPAGARLTFLGLDPKTAPVFAADLLDLRIDPPHPPTGLRELMAELDPAEAALAAYAVGVIGWHRVHRHCGRCGHATAIEQAGHRRRCPNCGLPQFPRTDPAVTMLVQTDDGNSCLLSRRHGAPANRWSALAGFVEPGETPEQAVVREAKEETGVEITEVEYVTSQPWPFPSALMIGFWAFTDRQAGDPAPTAQPAELVEARWFERDALRTAIADGRIVIPPPGTIGNFLISGWLTSPR